MIDYTNAATEPEDDGSPLAARNWPDLKPDVFQGVCGEIVTAVMPHTEADPAAVIATLLAAGGCMAGRGPHALAGNDQHPARVWPLIVGRTSDGAKGTSWSGVRPIIDAADPLFLSEHLLSGIVSGEGIIERVRDQIGQDPDDKNFDEGVTDKRLLILETEFASVMAKGARQGSSLFPTARQSWDGGILQSAARRSNALRASDPHIVLLGHVTPGEFRARLTDGEVDGGTVNRLLIVLSRRSKELPDGGNLPTDVRDRCAEQIRESLKAAKTRTVPMGRTDKATQLWRQIYPRLVAPKPDGWFASATARAHAQVLRLSVAYAILDRSPGIDLDHLKAALAMWDYAEASAKVIFAELGYEARCDDAEKVLKFIGERGSVTRNDLCDQLFQKHKKSHDVDAILRPLIDAGQIAQAIAQTPGRSKTFYTLRDKREKRDKPANSEDSEDFSRLSRTAAGKGSGTELQVNRLNPLIPLSPQGEELQAEKRHARPAPPPGGLTPNTPGLTNRVQQIITKNRTAAARTCPGCGTEVQSGHVQCQPCYQKRQTA